MASLAIMPAAMVQPGFASAHVQNLSRTGIAICSLATLDAWAEAAAEGQTLLYAKGCGLPKWSPVPARIRVLNDAGLISLRQARHSEFDTDYIARRSAAAWTAPARAAPMIDRRPPIEIGRTIEEEALIELLASAAAIGAPCPSNAWLAGRIGASGGRSERADENRVTYLLDCLEAAGKIRREASAFLPGRIITVVETGESTGIDMGARSTRPVRFK